MGDSSSNNGGKTAPGRFQRGNRIGRGRPAGSRNKATLAIDKLLDGQAKAVTQKCVAMALDGDSTAMRLVMERIAPVRRGRPVTLALPAIDTAEDLIAATATLVEAMGAGDVTPDEAAVVAGVLEVRRKALETAELEKRIVALEARGGAR